MFGVRWQSEAAPALEQKELTSLLSGFDFDASPDADVARCERAMFKCVRQEAAELQVWLKLRIWLCECSEP